MPRFDSTRLFSVLKQARLPYLLTGWLAPSCSDNHIHSDIQNDRQRDRQSDRRVMSVWLVDTGGSTGHHNEQISQDTTAAGGSWASSRQSWEEHDVKCTPHVDVTGTWTPRSKSCISQQRDHTHRACLSGAHVLWYVYRVCLAPVIARPHWRRSRQEVAVDFAPSTFCRRRQSRIRLFVDFDANVQRP